VGNYLCLRPLNAAGLAASHLLQSLLYFLALGDEFEFLAALDQQ